nr:hypothetical protein OG781_42670 [Streptomyces sp. NBC_00830]
MIKAMRAAVVGLVVACAGACSSGSNDVGLDEARAACKAMLSVEVVGENATAADLVIAASHMDPAVEHAALAAQKDSRWDKLSNGVTDLQELTNRRGLAADVSVDAATHEGAVDKVSRLSAAAPDRVVAQECRKANAG